jgi:hypothetical protein
MRLVDPRLVSAMTNLVMTRTLTYLRDNTITIGDGRIANFCHAPWLHGLKPKGIALYVFLHLHVNNFPVN